jgi:hypothetical protein
MKVIKKTADYTVYQKRSGRYAVQSAARQWINGDNKVAILLSEALIKAPEPKVIAVELEAVEFPNEDVMPAEPDSAEAATETPEAEMQDVQAPVAEASDAVGVGESSEAEGDEAEPTQKET